MPVINSNIVFCLVCTIYLSACSNLAVKKKNTNDEFPLISSMPLHHGAKMPFESENISSWESGDGAIIVRLLIFDDYSESQAKAQFKDRANSLESFYKPYVEPYYGTVHDNRRCHPNIASFSADPKTINGTTSLKLFIYANENFVPQACPDETAKYIAEYSLLYCSKENSFFEVRAYLASKNKSPPMFKSNIEFNCK